MIDSNVYKMNYSTGKLESLAIAPELKRGQLIYAYGYAGNLQMFAVTDPATRQCVEIDRQPVNGIDDLPDDYFSPVHTYDKRIEPHSAKFGTGFYYADEEGEELATEDQIAAGLLRAANIERFRKEAKDIQKAEFIKAQDEARKEYGAILTEITGEGWRRGNIKTAADNLRKLLKVRFPGVKFSVKQFDRGSDYYEVRWTDGPKWEAVNEVCNIFDDSVRDRYNPDLWDNVATGFTSLFGSLSTHCQREISEEKRMEGAELLQRYYNITEDESKDAITLLNSAKGETVPEEVEDAIREQSGKWYKMSLQEWAYIVAAGLDYTPERKEPAQPEPIKAEGVEIIDYSEKALAVVGDTRKFADTFKALGGRFNPRLSCGAGWIFSKRKEDELRAALAL